jgi:hypothetical protein
MHKGPELRGPCCLWGRELGKRAGVIPGVGSCAGRISQRRQVAVKVIGHALGAEDQLLVGGVIKKAAGVRRARPSL